MAKTISIALQTLLTTAQYIQQGDLYTLTLASGSVIRWADAPIDITVGGNTYLSSASGVAPGLKRSGWRCAIGLQVETMTVDLMFDPTTLILGSQFGAFANAGGFDGARIVIDKLLTPDFTDTSRGVVNLFNGLVNEVDAFSSRVTLHASNDLVFLNKAFPPNYFLPACNHALFDAGCGLVKATYAVAVTALGGGTNKSVSATLGQATGYFDLGYINVLTGPNAGLQRSVRTSVNTAGTVTFSFLYPLPAAFGAGDTFTAYPGCDKTEATCSAKFANLGRFRGFPFVPTPETISLGTAGSAPEGAASGNGGGYGTGSGGQNSTFNQF